jgi:peptidyl-dipeptidase Dcp
VNSFDHPRGEVHYDAYRAEDALPALQRAEAAALEEFERVPTHPDPLWAFGEATAAHDFIVAIADDMAGVLGGAWHDVARAVEKRAARFRSMVCQRRDLYDAIGAVAPSGPVEERLRADLLHRFEHHGAHLDEPARDRLTAINARLAELASDFAANMRAADATSGVATDDPTGLPDALVAAARDAAVERGLTGFTCLTPSRTRSWRSRKRRTTPCARRCTG